MSAVRKELEDALRCYVTDILTDIQIVKYFCEKFSKWMLWRETELEMIRDIKDRADKVKVKQSAELEKELEEVLMDTLGGLETLQCFLDAIEKLAVSSVHVFMENQLIQLPENIGFDYVQVVINTAKLICPLLLEFKRDASVFFLPKMQNAEVLAYQLDRYIQTTKKMCEKMEKSVFHSCLNDGCLTETEVVVKLDVDLSEFNMQRMLDHINQLKDIRMDLDFRMVFLFQEESGSSFMKEFSERQPRMLQFLNELEENAVQLDSMNKGAKISSVVGSSVGAVGGVLSIVGLALMPFTAGISLALTMTGVGMGVTSGVNSIVTTATELGVNRTHQKKASEVFQSFMEDVTKLQDCLEKVGAVAVAAGSAAGAVVAAGSAAGAVVAAGSAAEVGAAAGAVVAAGSAAEVGAAAGVGAAAAAGAGAAGGTAAAALRSVPKVASDIPDIGQAAVKSSLALSKSARAGLIAVNALFLGMDLFFICKDSISLAEGSETEVSQFIRARAALWSSEMDSWKKIHDSLCDGQQTSGKKEALLETPFYLNTQVLPN
ncbi:uncharacterized protein LOC111947732 isoform X5 [Oryzias latipes]